MEIATTVESWEQVQVTQPVRDPAQRLEALFHSVCDGLYRFILVRVRGDREAADDLLQQTCHEAARSQSMPDDDEESQAWLFGVARNLIRRHWSKAKRSRAIGLDGGGASGLELAEAMESGPLPAELLGRAETSQQVLHAITSLRAESQRLVFAVYFDGRPHADVARELGISEKSVEMRLYRIRDRLRLALKDMDR